MNTFPARIEPEVEWTSHPEVQYLDLLRDVLENGVERGDRTGVGTRGVFGRQMRFDLSRGFPLLTTKKLHFRSILVELLWFLRGETNVGGYCNKEFDRLTDEVLQETDMIKRNLLIKQAFEIAIKDYAFIPLHQQSLAWGVSKKLKVVQRADNQVLPYWMVKQEE